MKEIEQDPPDFVANAKTATLVHLKNMEPGSFSEYIEREMDLNSHLFNGPDDPRLREGYDKYVEHLLHFEGLCKQGENVEVIVQRNGMVFLSPKWKGEITPYQDISIDFIREKKHMLSHPGPLIAIITHYGFMSIPYGSLEHKMGSTPGEGLVNWPQKYSVSFKGNADIAFNEIASHPYPTNGVFRFSE